MRPSENCYNIIKKWEGCQLKAYKCPAGVLTIGWGSIMYDNGNPVKMGDVISQKRADELLIWEVVKKSIDLDRMVLQINQNQFDALTSFIYNLGLGAFKRSTLLKMIKVNPNNPLIRDQFMRWVNPGSTFENGLTKRRKDEANLYFKV